MHSSRYSISVFPVFSACKHLHKIVTMPYTTQRWQKTIHSHSKFKIDFSTVLSWTYSCCTNSRTADVTLNSKLFCKNRNRTNAIVRNKQQKRHESSRQRKKVPTASRIPILIDTSSWQTQSLHMFQQTCSLRSIHFTHHKGKTNLCIALYSRVGPSTKRFKVTKRRIAVIVRIPKEIGHTTI